MNEDREKGFSFSYSAPTEEERKEVASIQREYLPIDKQDKIERIKSLDKKVKSTPMAVGISIGVIGTLILGLGMTMVLEWNMIFWGVISGFLGAVVITLAYPIRTLLYKRNKEKYSKEILKLADEILEERKN
ncbi:MAG: hypothetical protein E7360_03005 [Clostridiales bacterium]|nr:hypothetical protein [Clostridiales bacterium]